MSYMKFCLAMQCICQTTISTLVHQDTCLIPQSRVVPSNQHPRVLMHCFPLQDAVKWLSLTKKKKKSNTIIKFHWDPYGRWGSLHRVIITRWVKQRPGFVLAWWKWGPSCTWQTDNWECPQVSNTATTIQLSSDKTWDLVILSIHLVNDFYNLIMQ